MDTFLIILGILLIILGIVGSIAPVLPGPPLVYASLICLQFTAKTPFSTNFMIVWALVTLAIILLDYYIPIWGTKRFGGTKGGTWGATIGLIIGIFFFPPIGLIAGPFIGAFIGEMLNKQDVSKALRSATGSFIGFLAGTFMKLAVCLVMAFFFVKTLL